MSSNLFACLEVNGADFFFPFNHIEELYCCLFVLYMAREDVVIRLQTVCQVQATFRICLAVSKFSFNTTSISN